MQQQFDRAAEDLGNSIHFEHVNVTIPDQRLATLFYVAGLGLTRDPYLMVSDTNMWINVGRSQFHLPDGAAQVLRGHTGLVWPKLGRPLLYAADAQWLARAVMEDRPPGPPARWIIDDAEGDAETRRRIAAFAHAGGEVAWCHDPEPQA